MKKVVSRFCPTCSREFGPDEQISTCPVDHSLLHVVTSDPMDKELINERYQMIGVIGEGGWSTVYKAKDIKLNRLVAVKLLHRHLVSSAEKVKRFQQEAESAAQLTHNNVVVTYDFGVLPDGQPYIVMEFLSGRSLNTLLMEEGRIPYKRLIDLMLPVCEGMHTAHEKGLVHRDLKPANIFVTRDKDGEEVVKVVDFGLAKVVETGQGLAAASLTETGATLGTPAYMSPEQCMGRTLDRRSDIYAIGCIMYEALLGEKPFTGETPFDCMLKHLNEPPLAFASQHSPVSVPPSLERAVFRCLAKDPAHRFQTAKELSTELRRAAVESCGTPMGQSAIARIITPKKQVSPLIAASVALALAAGVGVYAIYHKANEQDKAEKKQEQVEKQESSLNSFNTMLDESSLSIIDSKRITDEILQERLKSYSGYQELDLSDSRVSDKGIAMLVGLPRLKTLVLRRCYKVTDAGMDSLSKIPTLAEIDIRDTKVTCAGIAKLADLPELESLWISGKELGDDCCTTIAKMKHLLLLQADDTNFGDSGIQKLLPLSKDLKQLRLEHTRVGDTGLKTLGAFKQLVRLNLSGTKVTDAGIPYLGGLSAMRQFTLQGTKVSDKSLPVIAKMTALEELNVAECAVTDAGAKNIGQMKTLLILSLANTAVTDEGLRSLYGLNHLLKLNLRDTPTTEPAITSLEEKLPDCKVDSIPHPIK